MARRAATKQPKQPPEPPRQSRLALPAPVALDEIVGHERALAVLGAAIGSGRMHHAWIFHGPQGVGKFTTALALAAALLDPQTQWQKWGGRDGAPLPRIDPESPVQRMIRAGAHPDLFVVRKELASISSDDRVRQAKQTSIPLAVVREFLVEPASRTRAVTGDSAASRIFIVDEAELLNPQGQNALLKTVEEPPPGVVIILVTPRPDRLLPTVRSRCQRVGFAALTEDEVERLLARRAPELTPEQRRWLAAFSQGSPGAAELAVTHGLHEWQRAIEPVMRRVDAGQVPPGAGAALASLVEGRAAEEAKSSPEASKEAANRAWAGRMLSYLAERQRRQLRAAADGGEPSAAEAERCARAMDLFTDAERQIATNVQFAFVAENLLAQLACAAAPRSRVSPRR